MKICIVVDDYLPYSIKVGAKMMHELSVEFVKRGHEVTVITPYSQLDTTTSITHIDGVKVCYFRSGNIKYTTKVKRAINESLLSYNAWKAYKTYFREHPLDLIVYYSPSIFWGPLVSKLKKLWKAPAYLVLRDFFPQWVIDSGMIKESSIIAKYFRFFEKINYKAADTIGIQPPKNLTLFKNMHPEMNIELLYNWASNTPVEAKNNYYRRKYNLENKVVFFYGGNIGHAQDMMNIVRLAKNLSNEPNAFFLLVGRGDEVELVRNAIEQEHIKNILLLPPVSQDEFKLMLAEFDIGLFSLHKQHTTDNFPGKLLGYMVQEKPILGSVNADNDLIETVETAKAGYITVNGDDTQFMKNALRLLQDTTLRKEMGENAKKLLQKLFSVESAADKIINFYTSREKSSAL